MMLLIVPILNCALLARLARERFTGLRERILVAFAWWTFEIVAITELLSAPRMITRAWLGGAWFLATLALMALFLKREGARRNLVFGAGQPDMALDRADRWGMFGASVICLLVAITALVSPPNGSDQLQYHLPRMIEWADRHSVRFFPTHYYVQLFAPPLGEWTMLHTFVLTGGDRFVSLVQWSAFAVSAVAVSLIAKELGVSRKGQIFAAVLCITLPQGILAASGAKNDWVLALWLAAALYFSLRFRWDRTWVNAANAGIAVGATLLSKGTVYAFLPGVLLAVLVLVLRTQRTVFLKRLPLVIGIVISMNGAQWARNYTLGGSILGLPYPDVAGKEKYTVDRVTIRGALANTLRELAMHAGTPINALNRFETDAVRASVSRLGVNPDDPALTNFAKFSIPHYSREEYYAGNPLHLLLAIGVFGVLLITCRRSDFSLLLISIGIGVGFVFYCSLFKWEVWCARLHLPLFVLACPIIAVVVQQRFERAAKTITALLVLAALPAALLNETRPLLFSGRLGHLARDEQSIFLRSRHDLYFSEQGSLKITYLAAAAAVRAEHCNTMGLDTSVQIYAHEYPLLVMSRNPGENSIFRYLDVHNLSSQYATAFDRIQPCAVICPECRKHPEKWAEYQPGWPVSQTFGNLVVFTRSSSARGRLCEIVGGDRAVSVCRLSSD